VADPPFTDADNDGMDDTWELIHAPGGDISKFHPWQDTDGDGWSNLEEFLNGTNPLVGDDPMSKTFPFEN
jgi:pectate lyase